MSASLVLLALLAGVVGTTWGLIRAEKANADVVAKNTELDAERDKVQARFDTAMKAIETFHTGVSEDALLRNPQFQELRMKLLKQAAGFYGDLEKLLARQTDARSRKTLAVGYYQLGGLTGKTGDLKEAARVPGEGLAIWRELAAQPGADIETQLDVARSLERMGRQLFHLGDLPAGVRVFEEQRDSAERLQAIDPTDSVRFVWAQSQNRIGYAFSAGGKAAEAFEAHKKALAVLQKLADANPANTRFLHELALVHFSIGVYQVALGRQPEALEASRKALGIWQKLADADPTNTEPRWRLGQVHNRVSEWLMDMDKAGEALEAAHRGLEVLQKLVNEQPAVADFQDDLAAAHRCIGVSLISMGNTTEGLEAFHKARAICQKLADDNPTKIKFRGSLGAVECVSGWILLRAGKPAEAMASLRRALAIQRKLVEDQPATPGDQGELANLWVMLGRSLYRQKRLSEAFPALEESLAIRRRLVEAQPENPDFAKALGESFAWRGDARVRAGQPADAAADLRKALELWAKVPLDQQ